MYRNIFIEKLVKHVVFHSRLATEAGPKNTRPKKDMPETDSKKDQTVLKPVPKDRTVLKPARYRYETANCPIVKEHRKTVMAVTLFFWRRSVNFTINSDKLSLHFIFLF